MERKHLFLFAHFTNLTIMQIGEKMPDFRLKGIDGKVHTHFEFADKYALAVIFTCNSCKYSKAYGQRLIKLFEKYEDDNFGIIGINSNDVSQESEDSYEEMQRVGAKLGLNEMNFMYLHDENQELAKKFEAKVNPEVFLFNSRRELVYHGAIDDCWDNAAMVTRVYLEDAIEYALDGIEVDFPHIPPVGCPILYKK